MRRSASRRRGNLPSSRPWCSAASCRDAGSSHAVARHASTPRCRRDRPLSDWESPRHWLGRPPRRRSPTSRTVDRSLRCPCRHLVLGDRRRRTRRRACPELARRPDGLDRGSVEGPSDRCRLPASSLRRAARATRSAASSAHARPSQPHARPRRHSPASRRSARRYLRAGAHAAPRIRR